MLWKQLFVRERQAKYILITIYNTVILIRSVLKFLDRNFLFVEKVQVILDLILSQTLTFVSLFQWPSL